MTPWLGITWGISNKFGWGVYGLNLVLELIKEGKTFPVCLEPIQTNTLPPETAKILAPVVKFQADNLAHFMRDTKVARMRDSIVLHALGNDANWSLVSHSIEGDKNVGIIFFESTGFSAAGLERLSKLDQVIAGSSWNADLLRAKGVRNVEMVLQGVDTTKFRPMPKDGHYDGKFVIFSGGKLDFRKGQDIVLAAFKAFAQAHDDVLLVTAWQNLWPLTAVQMRFSPHLQTLPKVRANNSMDIVHWAAENGIPGDKIVDLGLVPNEKMPKILKEMDLAVFPNRCEGGTNLVAMETMACGVPCVIAANTGQKDLLNEGGCFVLEQQPPVLVDGLDTDDWGESSVDELVAVMERAYENRFEAKKIGQTGADFMRDWSWPGQIRKLLSTIEKIAP